MPRKKPTRKDNRYEYKLTLGRDIHGKPLRKSFYSTVSLADAKKKAEEFRVASEVSARTGEAFVRKSYNFSQWARKWLKYSHTPRSMLICVVNRHQVVRFQEILARFPDTFACVSSVNETWGNFKHVA